MVRRLAVAGAVAILVATAASRLAAPGPAEFVVEPTTGMLLVAIEPGSFVMGSPASETGRNADEQPHRVTVPHRFYLGRFEVTQTEWNVVMGTAPSHVQGCGSCPVEQVNFYDVNEFLSRLNARSIALRFRLPTEAEWEYACRAGTITPFNTGNALRLDRANTNARYPYGDVALATGPDRTTPAGRYPANAWNLHDMHGNVWEWTNDWYGPYDAARDVDPLGPDTGTVRVIRGGSWTFDANSARCALRFTHAPIDRGFSLGFRVVGEPTESRRR